MVLPGTRSWVTVRPPPVVAARSGGRGSVPGAAGGLAPPTANESEPTGAVPVRAARPPGQIRRMTRRIVAALAATRTPRAPTTRAPRRPGCAAERSRTTGRRQRTSGHRRPPPRRRPAAPPRTGDEPLGADADRAAAAAVPPATIPPRCSQRRLAQADGGRLAAHRSSGGSGRLGKVTPFNGSFVAFVTVGPAPLAPPRPADSRDHRDLETALPTGPADVSIDTKREESQLYGEHSGLETAARAQVSHETGRDPAGGTR